MSSGDGCDVYVQVSGRKHALPRVHDNGGAPKGPAVLWFHGDGF
jgi:hypothetical protein